MNTCKMTLRPLWNLAAGCVMTIALALAPAAIAAPCADFTDVDSGSDFCPNVEWLKNRRITLGCTSATTYCPGEAVARLTMAAFLSRLGTALTPEQLPVEAAPGAIDLDVGLVVCQTQDFVVADFPRRAYVDLSFNGKAPADVGLAVDVVISTNAGASWTNLNAVANRGFVAANQWGSFADLGFTDLAVGQSVRWGARMSRGGIAGATDLADSRCELRVLVYNRNGSASPF